MSKKTFYIISFAILVVNFLYYKYGSKTSAEGFEASELSDSETIKLPSNFSVNEIGQASLDGFSTDNPFASQIIPRNATKEMKEIRLKAILWETKKAGLSS